MRKIRKIELVSALFLLTAAWGAWNLRGEAKPQAPAGEVGAAMVLYYGDTCPHCKNVEEFVKENGIKEKLSFEEKEVYENQQNAVEMVKRAQDSCGLNSDTIGVPFFWTGEKCLMGDKDIIAFLKEAAEKQ